MDNFVHSLFNNLQQHRYDNSDLGRIATEFNKKELAKSDVEKILRKLSFLIINPHTAEEIVRNFKENILGILLFFLSEFDPEYHFNKCIVLGNIIDLHPDIRSVAIEYFNKNPSPFENTVVKNNPVKKLKMEGSQEFLQNKISDLDFVKSCYKLLKFYPEFFKQKWSWSIFIKKYLYHNNSEVRWVCCHCIEILTGMTEVTLRKLLKLTLSDDEVNKYLIIYNSEERNEQYKTQNIVENTFIDSNTNFFSDLVNIGGLFLPVINKNESKIIKCPSIIEVTSTKENLNKVALAIISNKPVCLEGPVGCGKTTLIEYVAAKTGRVFGKDIFKIQLGDQTDSKLLLGTYRCTDVPGEFIWQAGILTQAVEDGAWILLEDIDLANLDIASVIASLIENKSLSVPGYRDSIPVAPGFQIFLTRRLITSLSGHHRKQTNSSLLFEKHSIFINICSLSNDELEEIISKSYSNLRTIASRLVNVFKLFSSKNECFSRFKGNRLISTRDLFKWCSRIAVNFDISSQESALRVLQDAIDIYCSCYAKMEDKLNIAKAISAELGIISEKAEYFCKSYKPNLSLSSNVFKVGRISLPRETKLDSKKIPFSFTRPSVCLLEQIACCVSLKEPVLLVGETGTGKTTSVQYLAHILGKKLIVINMNQQSDSVDLLGGFKPVDLKFILSPLIREFREVFSSYFNTEKNEKFLSNINYCFNEHKWEMLLRLMKKSCEAALARLEVVENTSFKSGKKRKIKESKREFQKQNLDRLRKWTEIDNKIEKLKLQLKCKNAFAFSFVEGSLAKAVEEGHWVLLDEINLANAETLECLSGLLESSEGSLSLLERGDKEPLKRHKDFALFACMNPSTDVGKKDLPVGLRNRFTEFFIEELMDKHDLLLLVSNYLNAMTLSNETLERIVNLYLTIINEAKISLSDGLGHKPHYSLRSLCRALVIASKNLCGVFLRSLFESFLLSFLTQLDSKSYEVVKNLISKYIFGSTKNAKSILNQSIPPPQGRKKNKFVKFEEYWIAKGSLEVTSSENYVLTESVRKNLKDLARVVSLGHLPVLLQGETSVGKTSLITYLAKASGNKCVRINNHEHTDLQEYIGSYVADSEGKLIFREGVLVEAMRNGHWIILDELNLAPTDVLEALNRVLDDNRELFIPETQVTVHADPNFMLFATQNPPGAYGGRKMLSRAFRNRFVELHFNEIPSPELEFILHKRCEMPMSYAKKMVSVMTDLQLRRRKSATFAGKQGFITLRDLFRWGERYRLASISDRLYDWDRHLADEGYLLLAGRVRKEEEREEIAQVIERHMKRKVLSDSLFSLSKNTSPVTKSILEKLMKNREKHKNIVWTYNMRQLAVLVCKALEFHEPVLLVGETGGGKTTVCQLLADILDQKLITVNCHMHTESSDFIGGLRPVRERKENEEFKLFEWVDGPLIKAVVGGEIFLADEISLADDSVLERLNSLLESERSLLVSEKSTDINSQNSCEFIVAHEKFRFIATMNPGGDYGKKELSPALRNRFTEIWCESCKDRSDLIEIIEQNIKETISLGNFEDGSSGIGRIIMDFIDFFTSYELGKKLRVTVRDILTWVNFINKIGHDLNVADAILHGACMTFLDGIGSGITSTENSQKIKNFCEQCLKFLIEKLSEVGQNNLSIMLIKEELLNIEFKDDMFGIHPFYVPLGNNTREIFDFCFDSPTTKYNTLRLLRGMQLNKAILLEGSPGVGKTSLVMALAKYSKNQITRINLSDQTDISDLFGADLPVEGGSGGQFSWRDGPFLRALKDGHWILLDELNLASQSVLEGLNACLDHRGEIFIPELGKTFLVKPGIRLFACQNPQRQGGSRRGLPRSFLNRFTQVYVHSFNNEDLNHILCKSFPSLSSEVVHKMVEFNFAVNNALQTRSFGFRGSPWEFNLRDLTRLCEATVSFRETTGVLAPERFINLIYIDRMRTLEDKIKMKELFSSIFGCDVSGTSPLLYVTPSKVYVGDVCVEKRVDGVNMHVLRQEKTKLLLRQQLRVLRSLCYCVNLNWMSILVGTAGSGKSAVIQTLAQLTGNTIYTVPVTPAMDTADLLGGFEQTEFSRHLEDITKHTETITMEAIQEQFLHNNFSNALNILVEWEKCSLLVFKENDLITMAEASKQFLNKIQTLENLWNILDSLNISGVDSLRKRSKNLVNSVKLEGNLNANGKFEWVDSVLVKCLLNGYWLLIDNVNLCSPAVLDRLNAVLEPKGVLTIGERGVNEKGEIVQITPHKNFRLFLAMDPRNGEISRAMRNRGVEIYILNETEFEQKNEFDFLSLINTEGIKNKYVAEALLRVHDSIRNLVLGEKPDINQLLQTAFLVSQKLSRRKDLKEAFTSTIFDVYIKSKRISDFKVNDPYTIIKTEINNQLLNKNIDISPPILNWTLETKKLDKNSDFEKIRQQTSLLQEYFMKNQNDSCIKKLKFLLLHSYTISNIKDINLRHKYICEIFKNDQLFNRCNNLIKEQFLIIVEDQKNYDFPIDLGWLQDQKYNQNNCYFRNKCILLFYFTLTKNILESSTTKITKIKDKITILEYLKSTQLRLQKNTIDDIVVQRLLNIIEEYDIFINEILKSKEVLISDSDCIAILVLLQWRFAFYQSANLKIQLTNSQNNFSKLHLHYKWFFKFSINVISKMTNIYPSFKFQKLLDEINYELETYFSSAHKISRVYSKKSNRPLPLTTKTQIKFEENYEKVIKKMDLFCIRTNLNSALNTCFTTDRISLIQTKVKVLIEKCHLDFPKSVIEMKDVKKIAESDVQVIPVFDFFYSLILLFTKETYDDIKNNETQFKTAITLPPDLISLLITYETTRDTSLLYQIKSKLFWYQNKCPSAMPHKFINYGQGNNEDENSKIVLPFHTPRLLYIIVNLLISGESNKNIFKDVILENYEEKTIMFDTLTSILWKNTQQISFEKYNFEICETKYLKSSFLDFLITLLQTLSVDVKKTSAKDIDEIISIIFSKIDDITETNSKYKCDLKIIQHLLSNCTNEIKKLDSSLEYHCSKLNQIANVYLLLNNLKIYLNSKLPSIDFIVKVDLKMNYISSSIEELESLKKTYEMQNSIYGNNEESMHPLHYYIKEKINYLTDQNLKFSKFIAYRPETLSYDSLFKDVSHICNTILSQRSLSNFYTESEKCFQLANENIDQKSEYIENFINMSENTVKTFESVIQDVLGKYRIGFPDVVEPLINSITEYLYGYRLKISTIQKKTLQNKLSKKNIEFETFFNNFIQFPSSLNDCTFLINILNSSTDIFKTLFCHLSEESVEDRYKKETFRLIMIALQELFNMNVIFSKNMGSLSEEGFRLFDSLLVLFVNAWTKQQQLEEIKKSEKEALYKMNIRTEEELDEEQFLNMFPSYRQTDFFDLEVDENEDVINEMNVNTENSLIGIITAEDAKYLLNLHSTLVNSYSKTQWLNPNEGNTPLDLVYPIVNKFKLVKLVLDNCVQGLSYRLDSEAYGNLNVLISVAQKFGLTNLEQYNSPSKLIKNKRINFYKDANVEEVKNAHFILKDLELEVDQLLKEWPEHPGLLKIKIIIKRIFGFSITSPVARFLTGFEILLTDCHEWEKNAHSGVSLSEKVRNLVHQIISWRKSEMNMWKESLNNVFERMNDPLISWWFHFYNIMKQFLYEDCIETTELIETFHKFIFESNLAEFHGRLNLLFTFHCHATHQKKSVKRDTFINILWNIYQYFKQYDKIVENKIKDFKSPIEKKLKDYIKILKWKDISYWAIKETCEKSHKNLFKQMKEFEKCLSQPAKTLFSNITYDVKNEENVGIWDRPQRQIPKNYHYSLDSSNYLIKLTSLKENQTDELFLKKQKYLLKSRLFCKEVIDSCRYPVVIKSVDYFVAEVIKRSSELQSLAVDTSLPKNKQKSNLKSILQQKRKALSDLFKSLTKIGFSYRSGLVKANNKNKIDEFLIKPIDISAGLRQFFQSHCNEKLTTIWEGCETYFVRSFIRLKIIENTLSKPASDLGSQNVERCYGFANILAESIRTQKIKLVDNFEVLHTLRQFKTNLQDICESNCILPVHVFNELKNCFTNIIYVFEQYEIYLQSAPNQPVFDNDLKEIPVLKPEPIQNIQYKNDEKWEQASSLLKILKEKAAKKLSQLSNSYKTNFELFGVRNVDEILSELNFFKNEILNLVNIIGSNSITSKLISLKTEVELVENLINGNEKENVTADSADIKNKLIKSIEIFEENVLLSIQSIYKKYKDTIKKDEDNKSTNEEEQLELCDDHVKNLLLQNLTEDVQLIRMENILSNALKLNSDVNKVSIKTFVEIKASMLKLLPLLEQILLLYQYLVTQQVLTYRVSSKMTSIILNIFIDLLTKGFCVPPDISEDSKEGEGESQKGGFGLSDEQGEKDVSDRIESEDQLDDAKLPGDDKEKEDSVQNKEEENGIEMSEDFDSELQDVENKDNEDENSNDDSDAEEQMGETDKGVDKLDQQLWGSDEEDEGEDNNKEEKDKSGKNLGEQQLGAENEASPEETENKQKQKDIDSINEPQIDDDQVDPYHGNHPNYPEPESFDLPEDFCLDDNDDADDNEKEETSETNPFDVDKMKEQIPPPDNLESEEKELQKNDAETLSNEEDSENEGTEDEMLENKSEENREEENHKSDNEVLENKDETMETKDETPETNENVSSGLDQSQATDENLQAMDIDNTEATDNLQTVDMKNKSDMEGKDETLPEESENNEGTGQSQKENNVSGHKVPATAFQDFSNAKTEENEKERKRKPGEADSNRSLGDVKEPVNKKLKAIDIQDNNSVDESNEEGISNEEEREIYEHIKEAKESEKQVLDYATDEQVKLQQEEISKLEDKTEDNMEIANLPDNEEDIEEVDKIIQPEKCFIEEEIKKKKDYTNKEKTEGVVTEEVNDIQVDGEIIETSTVSRPAETIYLSQKNFENTEPDILTDEEANKMRFDVERQLACWNEVPSDIEAESAWEKISSLTSSLAQSLCEQLRLILEPTQASQLKGDYRTGKRINMLKVIPYIASQYRKDKIWLRRTKPSKRDYQIILAIDDSSSMLDNHSKELAFESVSLISKALSLLESGQLSVLGFGEDVQIVHKLGDNFSDKIGTKIIQKFTFAQKKTCIAKLVNFVTEMLNLNPTNSVAEVAKLLIIVSDGRGIFWEGESQVHQAVRRAKLANIFMVFVIIDNPENKDSVLDIRMPVFNEGNLIGIKNYMDSFPFPFYIILKDINSLPDVLSDALRQWFEIVMSNNNQTY